MQRFFLIQILLLLAVSGTDLGRLHAQETARQKVIVVADEEYGPVVARLYEAALNARIEDVEVIYRSEQEAAAKGNNAALLFSLDTSQRDEWTLRLQKGKRLWLRKVNGEGRDAAAAEAAAIVAAQASAALLSAKEEEPLPSLNEWQSKELEQSKSEGDSQEAAKSVEPLDEPDEPSKGKAITALLSAGYRGEALGPQKPWTSGAFASFQIGGEDGLRGTIGAALFPKVEVESSYGSFDISRYPFDLGALWVFSFDEFSINPAATLIAEALHRGEATGNSGVSTEGSKTFWNWAVGAHLGGGWEINEHVGLMLNLSLLYMLKSQDFVAEGEGEPVFSPYNFRPRAELGVQFRLF